MSLQDAPGSMAFPGQGTPTQARPRSKQAVAEAFLQRLAERGDIDLSVPGLVTAICRHFETLPTRYALDVNIDSLDVLSHKRLLEEARSDPATVSFAVRPVEVLHARPRESTDGLPTPAFPAEVRTPIQQHRGKWNSAAHRARAARVQAVPHSESVTLWRACYCSCTGCRGVATVACAVQTRGRPFPYL